MRDQKIFIPDFKAIYFKYKELYMSIKFLDCYRALK